MQKIADQWLNEENLGFQTDRLLFFEEIIEETATEDEQGGYNFGLGWVKSED